MAGTQRTARAVWTGTLAQGSGRVTSGTGALGELPVSWAARTEKPNGKTSPEELIAAAHAACFSMALSHGLTQGGNPPDELDVAATCTFEPKPEGGWRIASMDLHVRGRVPGLDAAGFKEAAQNAGKGCPVSGALQGNVEIRVSAELA